MNKLKCRLRRIIKKRKNRSLQPMNNKVTYFIGTRCTWKEKLPKMKNKDHVLLYGIMPNVENLTVEKFKQIYFNTPFELFVDDRHAAKVGEEQQLVFNTNTKIGNVNLNYVGVVIRKCRILETSTIANLVSDAFNNKIIKNHENEINIISDYCRKQGIFAYAFPPKYEVIDKDLSTTKMVEPKSYIIVNSDIIADVAIGAENIQRMIGSFERKVQEEVVRRQKQAQADEQEKLRIQAERRAKGREAINTLDKIGRIILKK